MKRPKVAFVLGGYDRSLLGFRGPLLCAMREAGWEVLASAPQGDPAVPQKLKALGVGFQALPLARTGLNPWEDFKSFVACVRLIGATRPRLFLAYTLKPVGLGCLAAWFCGVPRVYALITGLGSAFLSSGSRGFVLSCVASALYRLSLFRCTKVFVQNEEIARFLFARGIVGEPEKIVVVRGSGVDLQAFAAQPMPTAQPRFLFLGRFLKDKGVFELIAAARRLRERMPEAEVLLIGGVDANSSSVSLAQVEAWREEKVVAIQDTVADVRPLLAACTAFVLPSYHEGLPRSTLEAMATGRAVITTDTIGCRDTVFEAGLPDRHGVRWGRNGALVPLGDIPALTAAMISLARDPGLAAQMGRESRRLAEQFFDVNLVNRRMLLEMEVCNGDPAQPLLPVL